MKFCNTCGGLIGDNENVCPNCGAVVGAGESENSGLSQSSVDYSSGYDTSYSTDSSTGYEASYGTDGNAGYGTDYSTGSSAGYGTDYNTGSSVSYDANYSKDNSANSSMSNNANANFNNANNANMNFNNANNANMNFGNAPMNNNMYGQNFTPGMPPMNQSNPAVQNLVKSAATSGAFIAAMVVGILYVVGGLGIFIWALSEYVFAGLAVMIILLPVNIYCIGQIVFFCNGKSKNEYMSTSGMTLMKVGVIIRLVYEVIVTIASSIASLVALSRLSSEVNKASQFNSYFGSDGRRITEKLVGATAILWVIFLIYVAIKVLDIISLTKSIKNINILKSMLRSNRITGNNLSIFPMIITIVRTVSLIILSGCICLVLSDGNGVPSFFICFGMVIVVYLLYFMTGAATISFNHKLNRARSGR